MCENNKHYAESLRSEIVNATMQMCQVEIQNSITVDGNKADSKLRI
jgi:hypothetical protein